MVGADAFCPRWSANSLPVSFWTGIMQTFIWAEGIDVLCWSSTSFAFHTEPFLASRIKAKRRETAAPHAAGVQAKHPVATIKAECRPVAEDHRVLRVAPVG